MSFDCSVIETGDFVIHSVVPDKRSTLQRMICGITSSPFHHVETMLREGSTLKVGNPHSPYFTIDSFQETIDDALSGRMRFMVLRWRSLELSPSFGTYQDQVKAVLHCFQVMEIPYDWDGVATQFFNYLLKKYAKWAHQLSAHEESAIFCSELAQLILKECQDIDIMEGMKKQPFFAPCHMAKQYINGKFRLVTECPEGFHDSVLNGTAL